jgi:hypothetical protein
MAGDSRITIQVLRTQSAANNNIIIISVVRAKAAACLDEARVEGSIQQHCVSRETHAQGSLGICLRVPILSLHVSEPINQRWSAGKQCLKTRNIQTVALRSKDRLASFHPSMMHHWYRDKIQRQALPKERLASPPRCA